MFLRTIRHHPEKAEDVVLQLVVLILGVVGYLYWYKYHHGKSTGTQFE